MQRVAVLRDIHIYCAFVGLDNKLIKNCVVCDRFVTYIFDSNNDKYQGLAVLRFYADRNIPQVFPWTPPSVGLCNGDSVFSKRQGAHIIYIVKCATSLACSVRQQRRNEITKHHSKKAYGAYRGKVPQSNILLIYAYYRLTYLNSEVLTAVEIYVSHRTVW